MYSKSLASITWYSKLFRVVDKLTGMASDSMKVIAIFMVIGMVGLVLVDVTQRSLNLGLLLGSLETTEGLMAGLVFLMLAYAQRQKSHISVEFFFERLSNRAQVISTAVTLMLTLAACGLLFWQSIFVSYESWLIQECRHGVSKIPLWPSRFIFSLGFLFLCMQLAIDTVRSWRQMLKRV